jgi:hypothetical protein
MIEGGRDTILRPSVVFLTHFHQASDGIVPQIRSRPLPSFPNHYPLIFVSFDATQLEQRHLKATNTYTRKRKCCPSPCVFPAEFMTAGWPNSQAFGPSVDKTHRQRETRLELSLLATLTRLAGASEHYLPCLS